MKVNKEKEARLTQARLKEVLSYDENTGVFSRRNNGRGVKANRIAGWVNKVNGYRTLNLDCDHYKEHRLAFLYMTGSWPSHHVDHINGVRADNRWCNLREATAHENHKNREMSDKNTSGFVGVSWNESRGKWCAQITVMRKAMNLGRFTHKEDAIAARKAANLKYGFHPNHGTRRQHA